MPQLSGDPSRKWFAHARKAVFSVLISSWKRCYLVFQNLNASFLCHCRMIWRSFTQWSISRILVSLVMQAPSVNIMRYVSFAFTNATRFFSVLMCFRLFSRPDGHVLVARTQFWLGGSLMPLMKREHWALNDRPCSVRKLIRYPPSVYVWSYPSFIFQSYSIHVYYYSIHRDM